MVDEAKLRSPIHSTFGTLVVRYVVGCCCREESGPFCWSVLAAGIEFLVHLIDLLRIHLWSNGFTRIQKAVVDQTSKQWPWPTFCCKFGFGKCFGVSSQSSDIGGHCSLSYKFPFLLHTTIQSRNVSLLPERLRKDETSKQWFFFFLICSQLMKHPLTELFHFLVCFKYHTTVEWSMLSSWATSHVAVRVSALMMLSVGSCQLQMVSNYAPHLQGFHLLCKTSWTTSALYVL